MYDARRIMNALRYDVMVSPNIYATQLTCLETFYDAFIDATISICAHS